MFARILAPRPLGLGHEFSGDNQIHWDGDVSVEARLLKPLLPYARLVGEFEACAEHGIAEARDFGEQGWVKRDPRPTPTR